MAPARRVRQIDAQKPAAWKNGRTPSITSSGRIVRTASAWHTLATMLRWVRRTPFGSPVVPEEYGSIAMSVAGSIRTSGAGPYLVIRSRKDDVPSGASPSTITVAAAPAAARARSAKGAIVRTSRAPESRSWKAISSVVQSGLTGVTAPPASWAPSIATGHSGRLGARIASTSPWAKPRATSAPANRRAMGPIASKRTARPVGPSR